MDFLNLKLLYIILAVVLWATYVAVSNRVIPSLLEYWGFRVDNLKQVLAAVLPWALTAVIACILVGVWQNTVNLTWHILPLLVIYPIWGVVQQFLIVSLLAGNLQDLRKYEIPRPVIMLLTALVFGLVHYPYPWLIIGTFLLAILYTHVYLRSRNLWVLGVLHGWLGAIFFYTVVDRDPFVEVLGNLLY
ncbi:MAG: CPBP family intramembrane metalloprotease [Saprospiraceae bacterium]|nr:CPBP family intramembrane metalloprotease [Saprospiraceae bacterium]